MNSTPEGQGRAEGRGESLADLVARCLDRMEREGDGGLDAVCREHPERASALRRRVSRLRAMGLLGDSAGQAADPLPEQLGDFRLKRRLGGGGMGVVFLAEQTSLQREVALKIIRPEQLYFPGARARFRREIDAVARLQHPGIVPVLAGGEDSGVPYLAMELIRGASLGELLDDLADRAPERATGRDLRRAIEGHTGEPAVSSESAERLFGGTWTAACLRLARQLAEALAHAHDRGVLHRDVKPSNVMLTPDGRALLLDFGLAFSEGSERLTRTGSNLGSLPYMSPEQLRGEHGEVGVRSDVYSLGVTLYELLALRMPYSGDTQERLRQAILDGQPQVLRARNPAVSRDAETVCLTAMERDPGRRYASAAAFADDLGRALEQRPILARPAGRLLRARRWSQRHPATAVGLAAGALIVLGGPLAYSVQQHRANLAIATLLEQKTAAHDRAERNFERARRAVDEMLTRVGDEDLKNVPQMEEARRTLLEQALVFYEEFLAERTGDAALRDEAAQAARRVAEIRRNLGRRREAAAAFAQAVDLIDPAPSGSGNADRLLARAELLWLAAEMHSDSGDMAAADAALQRSNEEIGAATAAGAAPRDVALARARLLMTLGEHKKHAGDFAAAEAILREAVPIADAAAAQAADDLELLRTRMSARNSVAQMMRETGRSADALGLLREALADAVRLVELDPAEHAYVAEVGTIRMNLAGALTTAHGGAEAESEYRLALAVLEDCVRKFPGFVNSRSNLATCASNLGVLLVNSGRRGEALPLFEQAEREQRHLLAEQPEVVENSGRLTGTLLNRAEELRRDGELGLARALLIEAGTILESLLAAEPVNPTWRLYASAQILRLARVEVDRGDAGAAAELARRMPEATHDRAQGLRRAAGLLSRCAGIEADPAAAAAFRAEALELLRGAVDAGYRDSEDFAEAEDLAELRALPEFAELRERIAAAAK